MIFRLQAKIISETENAKEENVFDRLLNIKLIAKVGKGAYVYDSELKRYFEDRSALACVYEIETDNVQLALTDRLGKASEVIRKLNYRYDWIRVRVNTRGKVVAIENKDELKNKWQKLKSIILKSYEGLVLENYLEKIDNEFSSTNQLYDCINQYLFFGLLFLGLPFEHVQKWSKKRLVRLSEYEIDNLEEEITYIETIENVRHYTISGNALPESECIIDEYEGKIEIPVNELLPSEVTLKIAFTENDIKKTWMFNLTQF